jgi:L-glutamine-phosphate cytidylyltransferase
MSVREKREFPVAILAAGRGSRLGVLTAKRPKCLVEIGGRPAIDHIFSSLAAAGFENPFVIGGFEIEALRQHVSSQASVLLNQRWNKCGMLRSYLCATDAFTENGGLIHYGDVVTSASNLAHLKRHPGDIVIGSNTAWRSLWTMRFADPLSDAESFVSEEGRLIEIGQRVSDLEQIQGQFMGLLKFSADGWRRFCQEIKDPCTDLISDDTTRVLRRLISAGTRIDVVDLQGQWVEVDTPTDVDVANRILRERVEPHVWV